MKRRGAMYRNVLITCLVVLSLTLTGCGLLDPGSEEVAEAMKKVSGAMEVQKMDFWTFVDVPILLSNPDASGEALDVRLDDLQVQRQQPPAMPALRLVGQMHIVNKVAGAGTTVTVLNYTTRFLTGEGEVLPVEPDETYPSIEKIEASGEATMQFKALIPTVGDGSPQLDPDSRIAGLTVEINYGLGETSGIETLTWPLTFETE